MINSLPVGTSDALSNPLLQAQLEASLAGLLLVGANGKIIFFNRRFAQMWRLPAEVLDSHSDEAALKFVENQLARPTEFYDRVRYLYQHPHEVSIDFIHLKAGRILERYSSPVKDQNNGTLYGRIWEFRDVTAQYHAEQALRQSESRYRTLVDNSPVGIWQTTPEGATLYINRAMCNMFEVDDPSQMTSRTYRDFYTPESIAVVQREHLKRRRGEASCYEVDIIGLRGGRRTAMIYGAPILNPQGQITSFIASIVDVTEERLSRKLLEKTQAYAHQLNSELELRVTQRTRELEESHTQMEAFCYTVSHDLRAPLRAICSYAEILLDDPTPSFSADVREALETIKRSAYRMDQLLQDLLEFSKVARCELKLKPVDTVALVARVTEQIRAMPHAVKACIELENPLPPVLAHETALEQVFTNLIDNAQKFVQPGTVPKIRISSEQRGQRVRILVDDNGIGIPPEYRQKVFRVFERLHGMHEFSGTGIGLAIVKTYVEKMGGSVGIESGIGTGCRFWIELALAYTEKPTELAAPESASSPALSSSL